MTPKQEWRWWAAHHGVLMPAVRRAIEARFAADLARRHPGAQWFVTDPGDHPAA